MNDQEYQRLIAGLSTSRRTVLDAVRDHGPITDSDLVALMGGSRSTIIPRRSDLVHEGLVRGVGSKPSASGKGRTTLFEVVPPEDVEEARKVAEARGPRRLDVSKWSDDDKIRVTRALLRERVVIEAIQTSAEPGSRRARGRARQAIDQARRERADQIRREQEDQGEFVAFLKVRNHLKLNVEAIREVNDFLVREQQREEAGLPLQIPGGWGWSHVLELIGESIDIAQATHDRIAGYIGSEPRSSIEIIESDGSAIARARPVNPSSEASTRRPSLPSTRQRMDKVART